MAAVPLITGLSDIAARYDGFVVDLWGVMHDGVTAFPEALDCLTELRARGKGVAILSNAPRRAEPVIARNRELGILPDHFDVLMSSGEDTWRHLKERPDPWYRALGRRCYHFGPARDNGIREGLDYDFVAEVGEADFVLNTGAYDADDRVEDFADFLGAARARGLPMICANPDLEVVRGGKREICAGAIAQRYEELGGEVRYHGKPLPGVYRICFELLGVTDLERNLVIGDSLRTDIAGAKAAGVDALFVTGGIYAEELGVGHGEAPDPARLAALCAVDGLTPIAALPALRW